MTHGVLREIQASLERTYDVALPVEVQDYLLDGEAAAALAVSGDSVLVLQGEEEGTLDVGVYLSPPSLERLSRRDPFRRLDGENLSDFCAATEEVSHFTYLVWSALHAPPAPWASRRVSTPRAASGTRPPTPSAAATAARSRAATSARTAGSAR